MKKLLILLVVALSFLGCEKLSEGTDAAGSANYVDFSVFVNQDDTDNTHYHSPTGTSRIGDGSSYLFMEDLMDDVDYVRIKLNPNTDDTIYEGTFTYNETYNPGLANVMDNADGVIMINNVAKVPKGAIIGKLELRYVQTQPSGGDNRGTNSFNVINDDN